MDLAALIQHPRRRFTSVFAELHLVYSEDLWEDSSLAGNRLMQSQSTRTQQLG